MWGNNKRYISWSNVWLYNRRYKCVCWSNVCLSTSWFWHPPTLWGGKHKRKRGSQIACCSKGNIPVVVIIYELYKRSGCGKVSEIRICYDSKSMNIIRTVSNPRLQASRRCKRFNLQICTSLWSDYTIHLQWYVVEPVILWEEDSLSKVNKKAGWLIFSVSTLIKGLFCIIGQIHPHKM